MKRNTDRLHPRILELAAELQDDMKMTQMNLSDKALSAPGIKAKWIQIKFEEDKARKDLEEAERKAREEYASQFGDPDVPKYKTAKEAESSDRVVKLRRAKEAQTEVVRFLDNIVLGVMKDYSYDVSNAIRITQMESS